MRIQTFLIGSLNTLILRKTALSTPNVAVTLREVPGV